MDVELTGSESDDISPFSDMLREGAVISVFRSVSMPAASRSALIYAEACYDSCSDLFDDQTESKSLSMSERIVSKIPSK